MILREFNTAQFRVTLACAIDSDIPDLSWDESGETRQQLESGELSCFVFSVRVYLKDTEIAASHLGQSIYANPRDFAREHFGIAAKSRADGVTYGAYFPDMVREAIAHARRTGDAMRRLRTV